MNYVGIDLHSNNNYVVIVDQAGARSSVRGKEQTLTFAFALPFISDSSAFHSLRSAVPDGQLDYVTERLLPGENNRDLKRKRSRGLRRGINQ